MIDFELLKFEVWTLQLSWMLISHCLLYTRFKEFILLNFKYEHCVFVNTKFYKILIYRNPSFFYLYNPKNCQKHFDLKIYLKRLELDFE